MKIIYGLVLLLLGGCATGATLIAGGDVADTTWKGPALMVSAVTSGLGLALTIYSVWQGRDGYKKADAVKDQRAILSAVVAEGNEAVLREASTRRQMTEFERGAKAERADISDDVKAILAAVTNPGVPEGWLIEMAQLINRDIDNLDEAKAEFEATLPELIKLRDAPDRASNLDKDLEAILETVRSQSLAEGRGTLEAALATYDEALNEDTLARKEQERLLVLDTLIENLTALRDADAVAIAEMRKIELTLAEEWRTSALWNLQSAYKVRGDRYGTRIDLQICAALARRALMIADSDQDKWGAHVFLGNALQVLGSRGQEDALQDAVAAYREALKVSTREAAPMEWAGTQNNLGNVLQVLGERGEDGALQDAVAAYRAALEVRTRKVAPMDWAITQNNLGTVLEVLGSRGGRRCVAGGGRGVSCGAGGSHA